MEQARRLSAEFNDEPKERLLADGDTHFESPQCRHCRSRRKHQLSTAVPWIISLILSVSLGLSIVRCSLGGAQVAFWMNSDFAPVKRDIQATFHEVQFDATLRYNESHQIYRPLHGLDYVGTPSPKLDANWKNLIGSVNVFVAPTEREQ